MMEGCVTGETSEDDARPQRLTSAFQQFDFCRFKNYSDAQQNNTQAFLS